MRPGRIDRILYVAPPNLVTRRHILSIGTRRMPCAYDVDLCILADHTEGFSGAELIALCREAGLSAMREDMSCEKVTSDFYKFIMYHFSSLLLRFTNVTF
jgi:ATP-dependent 26S proteasome regulatory subunit